MEADGRHCRALRGWEGWPGREPLVYVFMQRQPVACISLEELHKSGLLKVMICSERFSEATVTHDKNWHIDQTPRFVQTAAQQRPRFRLQGGINMDDLYPRRSLDGFNGDDLLRARIRRGLVMRAMSSARTSLW